MTAVPLMALHGIHHHHIAEPAHGAGPDHTRNLGSNTTQEPHKGSGTHLSQRTDTPGNPLNCSTLSTRVRQAPNQNIPRLDPPRHTPPTKTHIVQAAGQRSSCSAKHTQPQPAGSKLQGRHALHARLPAHACARLPPPGLYQPAPSRMEKGPKNCGLTVCLSGQQQQVGEKQVLRHPVAADQRCLVEDFVVLNPASCEGSQQIYAIVIILLKLNRTTICW